MDAMFDSTVDMQDVFRDDDINMDAPIERPAAQPKTKDDGDMLGLEEEVKVTRKRQPVAKLDEDRLVLSLGVLIVILIYPQASIASRDSKATANREGTSPFQRKRSRDLARLLNVYQLWLDDLYPRAKFADGLAMIEKLGHKKRIQIMRREWIQEGKPREKYDEIDTTKESEGTLRPEDELRHPDATRNNADLVDTVERQPMPNTNLNGLAGSDEPETLFLSNDITDDQPSEDDLDALLAETADDNEGQLFINSSLTEQREPDTRKDDFDDEEALAAMGYD
ncbi:MAG: hypothetical protein Q9215_001772 [Flavoplaca cf. flavocitrina]